jgi:hypothetical protein
LVVLLLAPIRAAAQARTEPTPAQLEAVFPGADRFSEKRGRPPVFEAYRAGEVVGYAFLTSDLPPEMTGYSGPIEMLVGMGLDGTITGARVVEYHESLQESRGDFLARRGFQEQFAGKHMGEAFRVRGDVDNITGATITVRALSLAIRNSARRVAAAYTSGVAAGARPARRYITTIPTAELARLSWAEMLDAGLGGQVTAGDATISLTFLRDDEIGELLIGPGSFRAAVNEVGERVHEYHLMLLGVDGPRFLGPPPRVLFVQGADTLRPAREDFIDLGAIGLGTLEGSFRRPMLLLVEHALDVSAPFRIGLGRCCGDPPVLGDYVLQEPIPEVAPVVASAPGESGGDAAPTPETSAKPNAASARPDALEGMPEPVPAPDAMREGVEPGLSPALRVGGILLLTALGIAGVARVAASRAARRSSSEDG